MREKKAAGRIFSVRMAMLACVLAAACAPQSAGKTGERRKSIDINSAEDEQEYYDRSTRTNPSPRRLSQNCSRCWKRASAGSM